MNKTFFQRAVSLSLSAFFTVAMLAGIGALADTSAPASQMAGHNAAAPRA
jgi:predicted histidine transporter YuiF (NhaC family)